MLFQTVTKLLQENGSVPGMRDPLWLFLYQTTSLPRLRALLTPILVGDWLKKKGEETLNSSLRISFCL